MRGSYNIGQITTFLKAAVRYGRGSRGLLVFVTILAAIEVTSYFLFRVPARGAILLLPVAYLTFTNGLRIGLLSAAIMFMYLLYFYSDPGQLFRYTQTNFLTITSLTITATTMVFMIGKLHQQVQYLLRRNRLILASAGEGICGLDSKGIITFVNPAAATLCGWSPDALIGQPISILTNPHASDVTLTSDAANRIHKPWHDGIITEAIDDIFYRKDGSAFPVEYISSPIAEDRKRIGTVVTFRDSSARKHLEAQFQQVQKMEAVGQLAGGIAHDFNNLLTAIIGYTELLLSNFDRNDTRRDDLEEIHKAAHQAAALTRQLLTFSRKQIIAPQLLDLNAIVHSMDRLLQRLIGEDIDLVTILDPALASVKADQGHIEQVIMNLAVNARDAMADGGKLTIETANIDLDESYAQQHLTVQPGAYVMLSVTDTGRGMDAETQSHIFEPFFTTKEQGKGTGLGLSTVYGIVTQSDGTVWVYSEPGYGTTFKVYLPRIEEAADHTIVQDDRPGLPTKTATILLAEDDTNVRTLTRRVLETCGYTVLETQRGAEALAIATDHADPIDLLITDVVMPEMSGRVLAQQLSAVRPEIKILYISGYTNDAIVRHSILTADAIFLQKPFTPHDLVRKVREILETDSVS